MIPAQVSGADQKSTLRKNLVSFFGQKKKSGNTGFEPRTLRFEKPRGSVIMDCFRHVPRMEIRFGTSLRVPSRWLVQEECPLMWATIELESTATWWTQKSSSYRRRKKKEKKDLEEGKKERLLPFYILSRSSTPFRSLAPLLERW